MDGYGFIGEGHCLREQDSGHKQRKHFHGLAVYQILVGEAGGVSKAFKENMDYANTQIVLLREVLKRVEGELKRQAGQQCQLRTGAEGYASIYETGPILRDAVWYQPLTEVGVLAKTGAWDQVEVLAQALTPLSPRPPAGENSAWYIRRRLAAVLLVQERKRYGDAAAAQLAEIFSSLPPALWRP